MNFNKNKKCVKKNAKKCSIIKTGWDCNLRKKLEVSSQEITTMIDTW